MALSFAAQETPALSLAAAPNKSSVGSHGVMLQLPDILAPSAAGGDALIMICLWQLGVAVSDPGFSFYHSDLRMFDSPSAEGRHLLYALTEALAKRCDPSCQVSCFLDLQARQYHPIPACLLA